MARKLRGFERVLDAPSLFAVAYGEIASSLYIALGIVAAAALGLTPLVLLLTGALFFVVSLSYAEGTAAIPETGGAATFVRRAFERPRGIPDRLGALPRLPHRHGTLGALRPALRGRAISVPALRDEPWDAIVGCGLIAAIAAVRLTRRTRLHVGSLAVALLDLGVQGLLVVLGIGSCSRPRRSPRVSASRPDRTGGPRLRAAARDARVHRSRDRRQPRGGSTRARSDASALAVLRDRSRRRRHRADRRHRPLGVSGLGRRDGARRGVARGAARRDRGRVRRFAARAAGRRPSDRRRDLGRADPDRGGDDVRLGDHAADATRSRVMARCRASSRGSSGARSSPARRS